MTDQPMQQSGYREVSLPLIVIEMHAHSRPLQLVVGKSTKADELSPELHHTAIREHYLDKKFKRFASKTIHFEGQ